MNAHELYKAGQLTEAIEAQIQEVKKHAADQSRRLFLFELLAFAGELDRARRQIDALNYEEPELLAAVQSYRNLLDSEQARRNLWKTGQAPQFLEGIPDHVQLRLEAVRHLREDRPAEASAALQQANETAPAVKGKLNGQPFEELRDCDDLFAHVVEVMAMGKYFWVPLEQIIVLGVSPPRYPRDLLWRPAQLETLNGQSGEVFLPTTYPKTHESEDPQLKLGRLTDWQELDGGSALGVGCRMWLHGDDAVSLMEIKTLELDHPEPPPEG